MGYERFLNLKEVCKQLNISYASGKNWMRLGKLQPDRYEEAIPLFRAAKIHSMIHGLYVSRDKVLKSRRNKKYIKGSRFYHDYLSKASRNRESAQALFSLLYEKKISLQEEEALYLIADIALKMYADRRRSSASNHRPEKPLKSLFEYLNQKSGHRGLNCLMDDLIDDSKKAYRFITRYKDLFSFPFIYEEGEDVLGLVYLSLKELSNRKSNGLYYTPKILVSKLLDNLFAQYEKEVDFSNMKWLDPCSATGNFLLQLPEQIPLEHIFARDIDGHAVKILRLNLALKHNRFEYELLCKNCLEADYLLESEVQRFDVIFGNPPWGYDFNDEQYQKLKEEFEIFTQKKVDSSDLFVEKTIRLLKEEGKMGFVLPESMLNVKMHRAVRELMLKQIKFEYLCYLGNAFYDVQCPSVLLIAQKKEVKDISFGMKVEKKSKSFLIKTHRALEADCFSLKMSDEEYRIVSKMKHVENRKFLAGNAIFALGIVTGDNKKYLKEVKFQEAEPIVKGTDIFKFKIAQPKQYIQFNPQDYQQVAPISYYRSQEKLIYRFISNELVFAYDDQRRLMINSCNLLIPKIEGLHIKYILAVLNSKAIQFFFRNSYHSIKVLKSHLESLPIPVIETKKQQLFIDYVDAIMRCEKSEEKFKLYSELDYEIAKLFKLEKEEYQLILDELKKSNLFL